MAVRYTFVCPWFGPSIPGGAERAARELVLHLSKRDLDVVVFTTCAKDFYHWEPFHEPGLDEFQGVPVYRFPVNDRERIVFDRINQLLLEGKPISAWEETEFVTNIICSDALVKEIWRQRKESLFIFTPYMFGTTYWGARILPEKSFLIPCLHDEPYLHLPRYISLLSGVNSLIFYSEGEAELAAKVLQRDDSPKVIGLGIDLSEPPQSAALNSFRDRHNLRDPYLFLPGRKQPEKNTYLAIELYLYYQELYQDSLKLVFSGPGQLDINPRFQDKIIDLGYLSADDLLSAYSAAEAVCIPSTRESFSFTMFEAWSLKKPVLVHELCRATTIPTEKSNGGFSFSNHTSFVQALHTLRNCEQEALNSIGQRGYDYVVRNHNWDQVISTFVTYLQEAVSS